MPKQSPGDDKVGRMQFLLGLRRRGISDPAVLRAMDEVPREHFVEHAFLDSAYADQALPIACGQTISQPYVVAYMTEQLGVRAAAIACSKSAPARATRPPSCRGSRARWSASSATGRWRTRRAAPGDARLRQRRRPGRRRPRRRAGPGALRPHHRHGGRRDRARRAGRAACRRRRDGAAARAACRRRSSW